MAAFVIFGARSVVFRMILFRPYFGGITVMVRKDSCWSLLILEGLNPAGWCPGLEKPKAISDVLRICLIRAVVTLQVKG